jgi:hypothetical protein
MTRRLATVCLMTVFSIRISPPSVSAQDSERTRRSLKDISALQVLVEDLPDGAKLLGLTGGSIQTDVELKLRLAGMRVVTSEEVFKIPGMPMLYVHVAVSKNGKASFTAVELQQNVLLERNSQSQVGVTTWDVSGIGLNLDAQDIRDQIKDYVDKFLNAWLSVNPKK